MPRYSSPLWCETLGQCSKHGSVSIPCAKCIEELDPSLKITLTFGEIQALGEARESTPAGQPKPSARTLFPEGELGDMLFQRAQLSS